MVGFMDGIRYFTVAHVIGFVAFPSVILCKFHPKCEISILKSHFGVALEILKQLNTHSLLPCSKQAASPGGARLQLCWMAAAPEPPAQHDCTEVFKSHRRELQEQVIAIQK